MKKESKKTRINNAILIIISAMIAFLLSTTSPCFGQDSVGRLPSVTVNSHKIFVEVADTEEAYKKGLMWRKNLDRNKGMLFIYKDSAVRYFWMKNTFLPLDIAFIDSDMIIRSIHSTDAINDSSTLFSSYVPVQYVLEVNKGWLEEHGAGRGDTIRIDRTILEGRN